MVTANVETRKRKKKEENLFIYICIRKGGTIEIRITGTGGFS